MFFKLEKKAKKRKTHGKSKSKTSKPKKTGSKINGKKWNVKKGEKWEKMDLSICIFVAFFCFFDLLFFCFCFAVFLLLPGKMQKNNIKAKKNKSKKQKKSNKNANGQVHVFPIFSPFCLSFLFPFFPFYFALVFFGFCWCAFWCFHFLLHFSRFFSSFKKIRISYGLVNINVGRIQNWVVNHRKRNVTWPNMVLPSWKRTV